MIKPEKYKSFPSVSSWRYGTTSYEVAWTNVKLQDLQTQKTIKLQPEIQQNVIQTTLECSNLVRGMRVNPSFACSSRVDLWIIKHDMKMFKVDFISVVYGEV